MEVFKMDKQNELKTESVKEARKPDYSNNDGVAVWINTDKHGRTYLSIKVAFIGTTHVFAPKGDTK